MLDVNSDASGTFTGTSGTNSVTIVVMFVNGAEEEV
jgi:hypothetical protein